MPEHKNWKRLGLEVVVIVGSILLAFWIQAWWEGVQELEERDALVVLLREDIALTLDEFEYRNQQASEHADALGELYAIVQSVNPQPSADSMATLVDHIWSTNVFSTSLAAFEAAMGGPAWALIPPNEKVLLARFTEEASIEEGLHERVISELIEVASRHGGWEALGGRAPEGARFLPDYDGLVRDRGFETWLSWHMALEEIHRQRRTQWISRLAAVDSTLAELVGETPR